MSADRLVQLDQMNWVDPAAVIAVSRNEGFTQVALTSEEIVSTASPIADVLYLLGTPL